MNNDNRGGTVPLSGALYLPYSHDDVYCFRTDSTRHLSSQSDFASLINKLWLWIQEYGVKPYPIFCLRRHLRPYQNHWVSVSTIRAYLLGSVLVRVYNAQITAKYIEKTIVILPKTQLELTRPMLYSFLLSYLFSYLVSYYISRDIS